MKLTRHVTMWIAEGEFELAGERCASLWEPLEINVPLSAKPYACYGNTVVFYGDNQLELGRCKHAELVSVAPTLVFFGDRWWEASTGQVIQRNGHWVVKWHCCSNTARAREANVGREMERRTHLAKAN